MFFVFKVIFSALALWWGIRHVDYNHLEITFKQLPTDLYVYAFFTLCLCTSLNGLRSFLVGKKMGFKNSFGYFHHLTWAGTFFNQLLPSGIGGDAYRIYVLSKHHNVSLSSSAIIWDRILGLSSMAIVSIPMLFSINMPSTLKTITLIIYAFLILGIVTLILFIKFPILQNYKIIKTLWKILVNGKILLERFYSLAGISICSALINFFSFYLIILALELPLNFWEGSVLFTISLLISLIPLSISGWGIRESFLTAYLIELGLPPEKGFTLGILLGILMLGTGAVGAIFYLFTKNLKNSLGTSVQNR